MEVGHAIGERRGESEREYKVKGTKERIWKERRTEFYFFIFLLVLSAHCFRLDALFFQERLIHLVTVPMGD